MDCQNNFLLLNAKQEYQKTNHVRDIIDEYFWKDNLDEHFF